MIKNTILALGYAMIGYGIGAMPASAGEHGGTYPIFSSTKANCVVWLIFPFPCHAGFEYEEPGGPDSRSAGRAVNYVPPGGDDHPGDDDTGNKNPNKGGGNGPEGADPGNNPDKGNDDE